MGKMPTGDKMVRSKMVTHPEFKALVTEAAIRAGAEYPLGFSAKVLLTELDPEITPETEAHTRNEIQRLVTRGGLLRPEPGVLLPSAALGSEEVTTSKAHITREVLEFIIQNGGWAWREDILHHVERGKLQDFEGAQTVTLLLKENTKIMRARPGLYHLINEERNQRVLEGRWFREELLAALSQKYLYAPQDEVEGDGSLDWRTAVSVRTDAALGSRLSEAEDRNREVFDVQKNAINELEMCHYEHVGSVVRYLRERLNKSVADMLVDGAVHNGIEAGRLYATSREDKDMWEKFEAEALSFHADPDEHWLNLFEDGFPAIHRLCSTPFYEALGRQLSVDPVSLSRGVLSRTREEQMQPNYTKPVASTTRAKVNATATLNDRMERQGQVPSRRRPGRPAGSKVRG